MQPASSRLILSEEIAGAADVELVHLHFVHAVFRAPIVPLPLSYTWMLVDCAAVVKQDCWHVYHMFGRSWAAGGYHPLWLNCHAAVWPAFQVSQRTSLQLIFPFGSHIAKLRNLQRCQEASTLYMNATRSAPAQSRAKLAGVQVSNSGFISYPSSKVRLMAICVLAVGGTLVSPAKVSKF